MAPPLLLTDDQVQTFIAHGYLCLKTQLPESFHSRVYERFEEIIGTDDKNNPGNNLLPVVPELNEVFTDPTVTGALTSVVGPGYVMHPHRALHNNHPGSDAQNIHTDSFWGFRSRIRNHRPRWVMVMYVPQATPLEQGPTGVVPGSQYQTRRPDHSLMPETPGSLETGGFLLIHYDIWHRKMKNHTLKNRFMMKFEFARVANPQGPSWAHKDPAWRLADKPNADMSAVWKRQWRWMRNAPLDEAAAAAPNRALPIDVESDLAHADPHRRLAAINTIAEYSEAARNFLPQLATLLEDACDPVTIDAAYAMASAGGAAVDLLRAAVLRNDGDEVRERDSYEVPADYIINEERVARAAGYGLCEIGVPAAPALLDILARGKPRARKIAAAALGEINGTGPNVTEALCAATRDPVISVRVNAIEALAWKPSSPQVIAALSEAIRDAAPDVRFSAVLTLAQIGPTAEAAVPALVKALHDENRYVPGYVVEALERIGTQTAMRPLLDFLKTARWCPYTSPSSIY
jgi:HEAT repeat protein